MIASTARRVAAKLRGSSLPRSSLNFLRRELERLQEKFKKRSERIAELEKQVQEKEKELADAQKKIAEQEKQITDLERQLALRKRNSTNSSKPPSSDGLAGEQRPRGRKHKSQRKPGGQPGHPGHHRPLIPTAEVNVLKVLLPERCQHCGRKLPQKADRVTTEGEPRRHQVTEIPEINPHTTEYQCPQVVCEHCQKTTQEPLPEEVRGNFGPHLTALIAYWTVVCRVPRRLVEETGWRSNGDKRWIWTFVAKQFVFYAVASTRSAAVLVALLGTVFRGILCCDRLPVYFSYHSGRMQLCWAHLKRDILGIAEDARSRSAQQFGRDALAVVARLFRLWYRFRGDLRDRRGNPQPINRRQLLRKSIPLQKKLFALAETHLDHANKEVRNLATALYVHCERLFTFLEVKCVEPTNNGAERALRTAVQWRKICFGNRRRSGEIAAARLLTVTQTCKRQQRHVLGYLTEAVRCHRRQIAAPSLLRRRI